MDEAQQQLDQLLHDLNLPQVELATLPCGRTQPVQRPDGSHVVQRQDDVPSAWSSTVTPSSASLWRSWSEVAKSFFPLALVRAATRSSISPALARASPGAR